MIKFVIGLILGFILGIIAFLIFISNLHFDD